MKLRVLDEYMNLSEPKDHKFIPFIKNLKDDNLSKIKEFELKSEVNLRVDECDEYSLLCFNYEGELSGESNPFIVVTQKDFNYYWGEIHGHTEISDGIGESPVDLISIRFIIPELFRRMVIWPGRVRLM